MPPSAPLTVRLGRMGDGRALAELQDIANEGQLSNGLWKGDDWVGIGSAQIERGTTEMGFANTIVAERGDEVVGMLNFVRNDRAGLRLTDDPVAMPFIALRRALGTCIYLRAMAVLPEARGEGIAARLLDLCESVAANEGSPLGVIVHEGNERLIAHYRSRGYRDVATERVLEHHGYPIGSELIALLRDSS